MQLIFENDSLIAVNKTEYIPVAAGVRGGDSLQKRVEEFLAARRESEEAGGAAGQKAFAGLVHRIDQPVTGVVLFAKTPAALARLNAVFQSGDVQKLYWAAADAPPAGQTRGETVSPDSGGAGKAEDSFRLLEHYLVFNSGQNKSRAFDRPCAKGGKRALLRYRIAGKSDRYVFLEIQLLTGRPHQIRAQLAATGCHIKGDLKYGAARSNPGGGIHLHARRISFRDPETKNLIDITCPPPEDTLWALFPR
ncbi:MAG: RNA pseudouridine synthase [Spirochaetales bacterium]|nr:RNA pseudouridine synthase [Spirochaetales bacterium]